MKVLLIGRKGTFQHWTAENVDHNTCIVLMEKEHFMRWMGIVVSSTGTRTLYDNLPAIPRQKN